MVGSRRIDVMPPTRSRNAQGVTIHRPRSLRRRLALLAAIGALLLGAAVLARAGGSQSGRAAAPAGIGRTMVGRGPQAALIVRRRGAPPQPGIIFLHGWRLIGASAYRDWMTYLARRGYTVIAPRYQERLGTPPDEVLGNALAGIRSALRRVRLRAGGVVVVGHSAGAAMASDYAALAADEELPPARAVLAIYPGTVIRADEAPVTQLDPAKIPASTRLTVMASSSDQVVGEQPARDLFAGATAIPEQQRRLVIVDDPVAGDHYAPVLDTPAARRTFWRALDALLAAA